MKWIYNTENDYVVLVNDNIQSNLFVAYNNENYIKPKINKQTFEIYESATQEEITEAQNQRLIDNLNIFMEQKKIDGLRYYDEIELSLIIILKGLFLQDLVSVNTEIEEKIKPILNEIKNGDWFNAYMILCVNENYIRPEHLYLQQIFDQIKVKVKNYFENNYPRE